MMGTDIQLTATTGVLTLFRYADLPPSTRAIISLYTPRVLIADTSGPALVEERLPSALDVDSRASIIDSKLVASEIAD